MSGETVIHPSAVVEKGAQLGEGVRIGPFCHVSSEAVIGDRVELISHVTVLGSTSLGADCQVYPTAILGGAPQNVKHKGGATKLTVGSGCVIREAVTMHRGTDVSRGVTTVGDNCLLMAYSHVAHDCDVGNNVTMANYGCLGGHVVLGDHVIVSGFAAVHQFVRIGHHAFLAGYAAVVGDVIPYGMVMGDRAKLRGLNIVGMKRAGIGHSELQKARRAYGQLFSSERTLAENMAVVRRDFSDCAVAMDILDFMGARDKRSFTLPPAGRPADEGDDAAE
ncbi:acyl-ACP--UDP-N-acetylglucosamine O-acyltransferase [Chelativorans sp. Marseille-P2723]|uniref:acyl-ACP--UDP-N-acetylglucosamine O-acyltransferase n=1 Tax=Chelativorans sp. Marseille-P2723 TaxID=2709133 RepID=UPI00156E64C2|nr:acyl-ACP--UDP-N-acetylglucosamine O-acyltransferase [Chelativorans sp. Marseille-P2723]